MGRLALFAPLACGSLRARRCRASLAKKPVSEVDSGDASSPYLRSVVGVTLTTRASAGGSALEGAAGGGRIGGDRVEAGEAAKEAREGREEESGALAHARTTTGSRAAPGGRSRCHQ